MKAYTILALALAMSMGFAIGITDPYMAEKFESTLCYAEFADSLVWYDQDLYDANDPPAPNSLQQMREDLGYAFEGGMLDQLYQYGIDNDRTAFDSQVRTVMSQVYLMKSTFRSDARYGIVSGWSSVMPYPSLRSEVMDVYQGQLEDLQECLGGGPE